MYDRVFPWTELTTPTDALPYYSIAKQVWFELYLATYDHTGILNLADAEGRIAENKMNAFDISIGYIDYDFNSIDSTAFDRGALYLGEDSLLYDGAGDAYLEHRITLHFISSESLYGENISLYFDPTLHLTNTDWQI